MLECRPRLVRSGRWELPGLPERFTTGGLALVGNLPLGTSLGFGARSLGRRPS